MMRLSALPLALALAAAPALAPAAAREPQATAPRYVFVPVKEGALRLHTGTGEVSLCTGADGAGSCNPSRIRPAIRSTLGDWRSGSPVWRRASPRWRRVPRPPYRATRTPWIA